MSTVDQRGASLVLGASASKKFVREVNGRKANAALKKLMRGADEGERRRQAPEPTRLILLAPVITEFLRAKKRR